MVASDESIPCYNPRNRPFSSKWMEQTSKRQAIYKIGVAQHHAPFCLKYIGFCCKNRACHKSELVLVSIGGFCFAVCMCRPKERRNEMAH